MISLQYTTAQKLRIGLEDLKPRLWSGGPVTVLDARNDADWESSQVKIRGAIHIHAANRHMGGSWPKDRLTINS